MPVGDSGQPKGPTSPEITLEQTAFRLLGEVLPRSIKERVEYGAVICKNNATGALNSGKLHRSEYSANQVDVGLHEPNCGCPDGTTPVAFYHTHPFEKLDGGGGHFLHFSKDFSAPEDLRVANEAQLVAFLGSYDGKFRRYIPPRAQTVMVDGKPVPVVPTDAEGHVLPEQFNQTTILNGKLPTL